MSILRICTVVCLLTFINFSAFAKTQAEKRKMASSEKCPKYGNKNCSCESPGETIKWKLSYCLYKNETDDITNRAVSQCLDSNDNDSVANLSECDQNAYWRRKLCLTIHEDGTPSFTKCMNKDIPRAVKAD